MQCFTELPLDDTIVRSHPAFDKDGAWFNYVTASFQDTDGALYTTGAHIALMYFFPADPNKQYLVIHPAFRFCQTHSVLTMFYQMQYVDDPQDIYLDPGTVDGDT